jgi:hypothetical protein
VRKALQDLLTNNIDTLQEDIANLESLDRLKILVQIAKVVLPPMKQQMEFNQAEAQPLFKINWNEPLPPKLQTISDQLEEEY